MKQAAFFVVIALVATVWLLAASASAEHACERRGGVWLYDNWACVAGPPDGRR